MQDALRKIKKIKKKKDKLPDHNCDSVKILITAKRKYGKQFHSAIDTLRYILSFRSNIPRTTLALPHTDTFSEKSLTYENHMNY